LPLFAAPFHALIAWQKLCPDAILENWQWYWLAAGEPFD
jgi:hypothetical protein